MDVLTSFGFDYKLLIASVINFVILLFILNKVLYKPLLAVLDQRKKTIAESLENAQTIEQKLHQTEAEHKKVLHEAREQAAQILAKAEESAKNARAKIMADAQTQAQNLLEKTEQQLQQQAHAMRQEINAHTAEIVVAATRTILEKNTPPAVNKEMAEKTLSEATKHTKVAA